MTMEGKQEFQLQASICTDGGVTCDTCVSSPDWRSNKHLEPIGYFKYHHVQHSAILRSAHTAVFMCFVWVWEQTAFISLYSIKWLVCITETVCLLRGTVWIYI